MTQTFKIFKQLQLTTKKNEKIAILEANKTDILFTNTLRWLLNSFVISGISTKKIDKELFGVTGTVLDFPALLDYLSENNTGRDIDIATVQYSIEEYPADELVMCKQIVTKTLKLGVDAKTVNSVYGKGFIPVFDVQLGTPIDKVKLKGSEYIYISQNLMALVALV